MKESTNPADPKSLEEAEYFLRRGEIPKTLVHLTKAEHLPKVRRTLTLSPPVSATAGEKPLAYIPKFIPGAAIPIMIPENQRSKFKQVIYPYVKPGLEIAHQLIKTQEVESLSRQQVVAEYGAQTLQYSEPLKYIYELELRSLEPIYLEKKSIPETTPPMPESVIEYDRRYTLEELREMAKGKGLSPSGSKKAIAAKLIARG